MENYIQSLEQSEKAKYEARWKGNYRSQSALPFAEFLFRLPVCGYCLDIGCGDGATMDALMYRGVKCSGVDITLAGCQNMKHDLPTFEAPVWDMPFPDGAFDFTFSTDVLEHIPPELVTRSLQEIVRITKCKTIHQVACFDMGDDHLTIEPITWWKEKFSKLPLESIIMERK